MNCKNVRVWEIFFKNKCKEIWQGIETFFKISLISIVGALTAGLIMFGIGFTTDKLFPTIYTVVNLNTNHGRLGMIGDLGAMILCMLFLSTMIIMAIIFATRGFCRWIADNWSQAKYEASRELRNNNDVKRFIKYGK